MNRERSFKKETHPSLIEVEQAAEWYSSCATHTLEEMKKQAWLWKRVSCFGKLTSAFLSKTRFWKERYILPTIIEASLFHIERMNTGDFRRHEEEKLLALSAFLKKESNRAPLVQAMLSPELVSFLLKEAPSFEKQKDCFRKRCQKSGLFGESCVWYRNETFFQYVKRMEERVHETPEEAPKPQKRPLPHIEAEERTHPFMLSEKGRLLFLALKEHILELHTQLDEMKKQTKLIKHRSFLFRAEDETIFQGALLLEGSLVTISILFEEMLSHIPESGLVSLFENEREAQESLVEYEREVTKEKKEIEKIREAIREQESKLSLLKKNVTNSLQGLTKKISRVELLDPTTSFGAIQHRLMSQARHAIEEYRKGLTKAPGLLFSMSRLEAYIEDIITLCLSFLTKGKSQEALSQKLIEIEKAISGITVEGEEKQRKVQELALALQQVKGLYASEIEREKGLETIMTLYEEMKRQ